MGRVSNIHSSQQSLNIHAQKNSSLFDSYTGRHKWSLVCLSQQVLSAAESQQGICFNISQEGESPSTFTHTITHTNISKLIPASSPLALFPFPITKLHPIIFSSLLIKFPFDSDNYPPPLLNLNSELSRCIVGDLWKPMRAKGVVVCQEEV